MNYVVIIPIEVYAREIEHKLLLAYYLASSRGHTVLVAADSLAIQLALKLGENAVYLGKNLFTLADSQPPGSQFSSRVNNADLARLLARGVRIVFLDEEGGLNLDCSLSKQDCESFMARVPLNPHQYQEYIPNLVFCHWGPYQTQIAKQYCPNTKHYTVGAPCIDAARAFSKFSSNEGCSLSSSSRVSVLGSTTVLTHSAFQQTTPYLAIDWVFKNYDTTYTSQALLAEVGAASAAHQLSQLGYCVEYRAHPASAGFVLEDWYQHCRSQGIRISLPHREPILSFLSRSHLSIHTAGCTTSLLSYFLKRYSLRVGRAECGTNSNLLQEPYINSIDQIGSFIIDPTPLLLLPTLSNLIYRASGEGLVSFERIANVIDQFNTQVTSYLHLSTFLSELYRHSFPFVASRNLRHFRWWKRPKFSTFYQADIDQCFRVAQVVWPSSPLPRLVSRSSQFLVFKS